jgi:hypothetical protein
MTRSQPAATAAASEALKFPLGVAAMLSRFWRPVVDDPHPLPSGEREALLEALAVLAARMAGPEEFALWLLDRCESRP